MLLWMRTHFIVLGAASSHHVRRCGCGRRCSAAAVAAAVAAAAAAAAAAAVDVAVVDDSVDQP